MDETVRLLRQEVQDANELIRRLKRELFVISAVRAAGGARVPAKTFMQRCLEILHEALAIDAAFLALRDGDTLGIAGQRKLTPQAAQNFAAGAPALLAELEAASAKGGTTVRWTLPDGSFAALLSPLAWQAGGVFGALGVVPEPPVQEVAEADLALLAVAAHHVSLVMENIEYGRQLRRQARFRAELELARTVQTDLLPAGGMQVGSLAAAGRVRQADAVGGDYFRFIQVGEGRMAIAVADASGKGFAAALIIAMVAASIDCAANAEMRPRQVLQAVNRVVGSHMGTSRFVTAFYGLWDEASGTLEACNAGYVPPLWIHGCEGAMERVQESGPALGFVSDLEAHLPTYRLSLAPGDCLCLLSDGLVPLMDATTEPRLSDEAIRDIVCRHRDAPLEQALAALDEYITSCMRQRPQLDDITMVLLKRS